MTDALILIMMKVLFAGFRDEFSAVKKYLLTVRGTLPLHFGTWSCLRGVVQDLLMRGMSLTEWSGIRNGFAHPCYIPGNRLTLIIYAFILLVSFYEVIPRKQSIRPTFEWLRSSLKLIPVPMLEECGRYLRTCPFHRWFDSENFVFVCVYRLLKCAWADQTVSLK